MQFTLLNGKKLLEDNLKLYYSILLVQQQFRSRFILDPLSHFVLDSVGGVHKLETLIMATTLLRYSDCLKIDLLAWLNGEVQIIRQTKTNELITIPPLLHGNHYEKLNVSGEHLTFIDSYDKVAYSIRQAIPFWLLTSIPKKRKTTHIFRFLRSSFYHINNKPVSITSELLGHKSEESVESYTPISLIKTYHSYLSKGD